MRSRALALLLLPLLAASGPARAQDDMLDEVLLDQVMDESWGLSIEMLESDLDFLLESLEAEEASLLSPPGAEAAAETAPVGVALEATPSAALEALPEEEPPEPAPAPAAPPPAPAATPKLTPVVLELAPPRATESVFLESVSRATCACHWVGDEACSASVEWPADGEDCTCSRFKLPPGCSRSSQVISVLQLR